MKRFIIVLTMITMCALFFLAILPIREVETEKSSISDTEMSETNRKAKMVEQSSVIVNEDKTGIGWIRIENAGIDYPVMYSKDNQYYLKHNSEGKKDNNGAIFLDANSGGKWSKLNLIHGHNMNSGEMFGNLDKYKNESWCKKNLYIELQQDSVDYVYKVFSVFTYNSNKEELSISFSEYEDYGEYFRSLVQRSKYSLDKPTEDATVIMLDTCSYSYSGEHLLVCAYRE